MLIIKILCALTAGVMDRLRGDHKDFVNKTVETLIYGALVAICFGVQNELLILAFAGLWLAGAAPGWGEPISAALEDRPMNSTDLERWQLGILKRNTLMALMLRGFIWGFPAALLGYVDPRLFGAVAMTLVFPAAIYLSKVIRFRIHPWEVQEYLRGWIMASVAIVIGLLAK